MLPVILGTVADSPQESHAHRHCMPGGDGQADYLLAGRPRIQTMNWRRFLLLTFRSDQPRMFAALKSFMLDHSEVSHCYL